MIAVKNAGVGFGFGLDMVYDNFLLSNFVLYRPICTVNYRKFNDESNCIYPHHGGITVPTSKVCSGFLRHWGNISLSTEHLWAEKRVYNWWKLDLFIPRYEINKISCSVMGVTIDR